MEGSGYGIIYGAGAALGFSWGAWGRPQNLCLDAHSSGCDLNLGPPT
jgi:hypothetical protein